MQDHICTILMTCTYMVVHPQLLHLYRQLVVLPSSSSSSNKPCCQVCETGSQSASINMIEAGGGGFDDRCLSLNIPVCHQHWRDDDPKGDGMFGGAHVFPPLGRLWSPSCYLPTVAKRLHISPFHKQVDVPGLLLGPHAPDMPPRSPPPAL